MPRPGEIISVGSVEDFHKAVAPQADSGPSAGEVERGIAEAAGSTAPVENSWLRLFHGPQSAAPDAKADSTRQSDWHAAMEQADRPPPQAAPPVLDPGKPLAPPPNAFWDGLDA